MQNLQNPIDYFPSGKYKFDSNKSLSENYILFNQAISFKNGVEFLSSSNESTSPIIYLLKIPGLSINPEEAEEILIDFYAVLKDKMEDYLNKEDNLFNLYRNFFDIYNTAERQQVDYNFRIETYFGFIKIRKFEISDIKKFDLPLIRSTYRSLFVTSGYHEFIPINFEDLSHDLKTHLRSLYSLKRKHSLDFLKYLNDVAKMIFNRNRESTYYRYEGPVSDLIEIALILANSNNLQSISGTVNFPKFCAEFCRYFKKKYTKLSIYHDTIEQRYKHDNLFLGKAERKISACLSQLKQ